VGGRMTLSFDSGAIKRGELEANYRSSTEGGIM